MSEAEELLAEKLQCSDYIGVENLRLPYRVEPHLETSAIDDLDVLVDVYFDNHIAQNPIFTAMSHESLVEFVTGSVTAGRSLDFNLLAEKIAWDLSELAETVAVHIKLIRHNPEVGQGSWRLSIWRVSPTTAKGMPELGDLCVINPLDCDNSVSGGERNRSSAESGSRITASKPTVQTRRGNRLEAEQKTLLEVPQNPVKAVLALGGNLGDVKKTLRAAITDLQQYPGIGVSDVSPLIRTKAVLLEGQEPQPDYYNAVVIIRCNLSPRHLLEVVQQIELKYGRERKEKWGARTLDIDIITYGNIFSSIPDLTIPHPRAHQRAFVLLPWSMVEKSAVLPGQGEVMILLSYTSDLDGVLEIDGEWFKSSGANAEESIESTLPIWNNLDDSTRDIRIVDLFDDDEMEVTGNPTESNLDNMMLQAEEANYQPTEVEAPPAAKETEMPDKNDEPFEVTEAIDEATEETEESDEQVDSAEIVAVENSASVEENLESLPNEVRKEKSTGFWAGLKGIFGRSTPTEENLQDSSPEDFFALIENDNAAKEQQLLQGKSFTDHIGEINSQENPESEISPTEVVVEDHPAVDLVGGDNHREKEDFSQPCERSEEENSTPEFPPDTGEIPIQQVVEATKIAQSRKLKRNMVLRPSSTGPIPVYKDTENSV